MSVRIDDKEVIKVVQDLVKIPSENPPGKEKEVGNYIIKYMESAGIETKIQEVAPNRFNVISRLKGEGASPPIIFTGHMDVVPVSDDELKRWHTKPYSGEIIEDYLYGRGATDMKGGLGCAMVAMATLARNDIKPPSDIILVATVDEEDVMRGSKKLVGSPLIEDAKRVVVCEPTDMSIVTACRGRTWADITVEGKTAHASKEGAGINAIDRAALLMEKIKDYSLKYKKHSLLGNSFWQVTVINGGIEPAIVPDSCTITVDARLVPGQMPEDIWNEMKNIIDSLKQEIPDFAAKINVIEAREPWETEDKDFIKILEKVYTLLDIPPVIDGFSGTTDGTVFRRCGIEPVIVGPGHIKWAHRENEKVSLKQLYEAAEVYLGIMLFNV